MEVEVLGVDGAPDGAVVSIRAGSQRKQAAVAAIGSGTTPFRFTIGASGVNPFRIDLMQPAGTVKMALRHGEGNYTADLKAIGKGGKDVHVRFAVREAGKKGPREPLKSAEREKSVPKPTEDPEDPLQAAAAVAKEYLEHHQLLPFVRALIQTVIRERPLDPYDFIANQFRCASAAARAPTTNAGANDAESYEADKHKMQKSVGPTPTSPKADSAQMPSSEPALSRPAQQVPRSFALLPSCGSWLKQRPPALRAPAPPRNHRPPLRALEARVSFSGPALVPSSDPASPLDSHHKDARLEEAADFPAVKSRAREVLSKASPPREGGPDLDEEVDVARSKAQDALRIIMMQEGGSDEDEEGSDEDPLLAEEEEAKAKGRSALESSLTPDDFRAQQLAQASLESVLLDEDARAEEVSKEKGRAALDATMTRGSGEPELLDERLEARSSLELALAGGEDADDEEVRLKARARESLIASFVQDGPEAELEAAKLKAQRSLDLTMSKDPKGGQAELDAKLKARCILDLALLGEEDADATEVGQLKAAARETLQAALVEDTEDPEELFKAQARAVLEDFLAGDAGDSELDAKAKARSVLDLALLSDEEAATEELDQLRAAARDVLQVRLLEGGPEDTGDADDGLELSKERARSVLDEIFAEEAGPSGAELSPMERDNARRKAREALGARFLADEAEPPPSPQELKALKGTVREALKVALLSPTTSPKAASPLVGLRAGRGGCSDDDGELLSPKELQVARRKAREAMSAALLELRPGHEPSTEQQEDLRITARNALHTALFGDEEDEAEEPEPTAVEMEQLRGTARDALQAALLGDEAEEPEPTGVELEQLRGTARDALHLALLGDEAEEPDTEELEQLKGTARDALQMALLEDAAEEPEPDTEEVEQFKSTARNALQVALFGDAPEEPKPCAKEPGQRPTTAQEALQVLENAAKESEAAERSPGVPRKAAPPTAGARSPEQEATDPELNMAKAVQARLELAKEQVTNTNLALKEEVNRLNQSMAALLQQRDAMKRDAMKRDAMKSKVRGRVR